MRLFLLTMSTACLAFFLQGCGGGDDITLYDLNGSVSFDGKPVTYGRIQFRPDTAKQNSGPMGAAIIINGKYDTTAEGGKGVVGGAYIIVITGFDQKPPATGENEDETAESTTVVDPSFQDFQIEVELPKEATTKDFEVPADAAKK